MAESNQVEARSGGGAYRAGVGIAGVASLLLMWTTIVRDDGNAMGHFMAIMTVGVGWFAASFRAAGMARTMLGVAIMQAAVGMLIATAPVTANVPGESFKALLYSGFFAVLWLVSGGFFRAASRTDRQPLD